MTAPTLTEFLLARIAEMEGASDLLVDGDVEWIGGRIINPHAMLLADCKAKRRIVEDWNYLHADYQVTHDPMTEARRLQALVAASHLAAVYSDHPDYDEEWRA